MTGVELIAKERQEQIEKHGRTIEHDLKINKDFQLAKAASLLTVTPDQEDGSHIIFINDPFWYPDDWDISLMKRMLMKTYKERLIISGALIAAEIDRIQLNDNAKSE